MGRTFHAVDLDATNDDLPFGIAVANVQLEADARVAIQIPEGQDWQQIGPGFTVESLQLHSVELPDRHQEPIGRRARGRTFHVCNKSKERGRMGDIAVGQVGREDLMRKGRDRPDDERVIEQRTTASTYIR